MPIKWQVWTQPDGRLVWVPATETPPTSPPEAPATARPPDPAPPRSPPPDGAPIEENLGADGADGGRLPLMASLLLQALDKLTEGNGKDALTEGVNTGGLFSTGSGRLVAVSERAIRRASALVGEEMEEATNSNRKRKVTSLSIAEQPFGDDAGLQGEQTNLDVPLGGGAHKDNLLPMFQTGSGKIVPLSKDSVQKSRAVLEENVENAAGARQPMFHTGTGRSVLVSKSSIDKARAVLEGQTVANEGDAGGMEQFPMFQTGSGRAVSISMASVQKAKAVLDENNVYTGNVEGPGYPDQSLIFEIGSGRPVLISERSIERSRSVLMDEGVQNTGQRDTGDRLPIFQTGTGRPVAVKHGSIKKAKAVLEDGDVKRSGNGDDICATSFQFETPTSVLMSSSLIMNDRTVTPKENTSVQEKCYEGDGHLPLFQTGLGRSVTVSKSSIKRASAILEPRNIAKELEDEAHLNDVCATSIIKTGLGKSVLSENSKENAQVVSEAVKRVNSDIGDGFAETPMFQAGIQQFSPENGSSRHRATLLEKGKLATKVYEDCGNSLPMFQTGSGKSVLVSESSVRKARAVLEDEGDVNRGESKVASTQIIPCRTKLSARYPFQHQRKSCKEYFGGPPRFLQIEHVTDDVKLMDAKRAEKFKFQHMGTGAEDFQKMLLTCGASISYATKEWVSNHYKWIVWKLASLERCYPTRAAGKFLTVDNVFEELKYRYDREVNHGHRSAIKKILEGNASPSLMMVLCISAIYSCPDQSDNKLEVDKIDNNEDSNGNKSLSASNRNRNMSAKIELTDGWYSLDASLDMALSEQLQKRKLFLGQKLRIWGASLCGWSGPVSFHEASGTVKLMVHINGTYRARWNETLGFCKHAGLPLAFKCIKASGGRVPRTLVGITRIYPVLFRERLPDGRSIVRSERMERKALQLYHQRVSMIAEDIMFEQQENCDSTDDNEEGAEICKMLERAAEPEVIMAGMTSEQLMHFSSYKEKQKEIMQNEVAKKVQKVLEVADLSSRDVTPFLKVRVMGLVSKLSASTSSNKGGLITIWNPTEMQKANLVEGQIYSVTGLMPSNNCTEILYLHGRGSSTTWKPLASTQTTDFEPFFTPRKAIELSKFGEVPLSSEFDIAGFILYVGNMYLCNNQKRQWLFITDGSKFISEQKSEEQDCLLAVIFSSPTTGEDSALFSNTLSGNTVGFSNLVKRQKNQLRHIWVADATESSTYTLSHEIPRKSHLKEAAASAERWASRSCHKIQELKQRVLCIVGDSGG
ncbi:protein BREAST CANCER SUSCEPTIBILITY 2 homolog B-like isoform X11 [Panicum virgatum]|uniref:protein BREAST CANCER SUSCEPTIBILITY 2 homolog B-like isoform X11 n=1 Tax=Panicum virgatum TaxID=38727 RepID=UPI0019D5B084|nr:protein BREAST CANCER SUSCEPTIBILITY 2 homolog B-like isoform X11 [Panicum virgatum]